MNLRGNGLIFCMNGLFAAIGQLQLSHAQQVLPIEPGNIGYLNLLGAFSLTGFCIGAISKAQLVHLGNHFERPIIGLHHTLRQEGKLRYLGLNKKHGRGILAGRHAGATANAGSSIHGQIGTLFRDGNGVCIGYTACVYRNVSPLLNQFVES